MFYFFTSEFNYGRVRYSNVFVLLCCLQLLHGQKSNQLPYALNNELSTLKDQLETADNTNDLRRIGSAHLELADYFNQLKLYGEAAKHYNDFLNLHVSKDSIAINVHNKLAKINLQLNKYIEAKSHASSAQTASELINYFIGKAVSSSHLGSVEEKQGNYLKALDYQNKSLSIFQSINDSIGLARTNDNIGSIYEDLEQYDLALDYFLRALLFSKVTSDTDVHINIINNLGDIYRKTKEHDLALEYTRKALNIARRTKNQSQEVSALKDLAKTYADIGNFKSAYQFLNHQIISSETALIQENAQLLNAMEVLYGLKEKQQEVRLLNKQNKINAIQKQVILIISGAVLVALLIGLLYWRKRREHDKNLYEYEQQLLQADLDKKTAEERALNREIDIKISSLTNYSLNLAHKNKMLTDISKTLLKLEGRNSSLVNKKLKELAETIQSDLNNSKEWTQLMIYFSQIHPGFFETLKKCAIKNLSSSELRLSMLLRLNLSSKDVAEILHITNDSVRIARYRLRKKLPFQSQDDLQDYLLSI